MNDKVLTNLDRIEYEQIEGINYSILKLFDKSPAHARQEILHPKKPSPAMEFGQVVHTAILEPRKFYQTYVKLPAIDRRTKEGKETWAKFEAENPGKIMLSEQDYFQCVNMITSAKSQYTISQLLYGKGANEVTLIWKDAETNLLCKGRIDRYTKFNGYSCVIDIKTTTNAQEYSFAKKVAEFNWHLQAAFYLDALETIQPAQVERRYILIAMEKDPPYACMPYELDNDALDEGRRKYQYFLKQYKECVETGIWRGYPDEIQMLKMPAYSVNNYYEFEEQDESII